MRRPTIILVLLFALIAGITWYTQQPGNPIKQALVTSTTLPAANNNMLVNPNGGSISNIQIRDASGKSFTLSKKSGSWVVNDGKNGAADQSRAEAAASMAYSMQVVTKLEKAPDPTGTGLDKPAYTANITQDSGVTSFRIGRLAATGSGYYVQTADGSVYIIGKDGIDSFVGNLANPPLPLTATPTASSTKTP